MKVYSKLFLLPKVCMILLLLVCSSKIAPAQPYPAFTATVYDSSSTGYYFLCPLALGSSLPVLTPTQLILDHAGQVVYYKTFPTAINTGDFKLLSNGLLSYSLQGKFYMMDSTFNIVDSVSCKNGIVQDGHDMQLLSNGHYLLLGTENITMDLSSYNMFNHNGSPGSTTANVKCGVIQEQDMNKNVVFEWHAKDYFQFADVDETFLNGVQNVDWTHFNAVEQDMDGNILLSSRHFNEITKINRSDSSIIWRLGGKQNQFVFTNDSQQFKGQHDIRRLTNGHITLFDNGNGNAAVPFHPATAKEFLLDETLLTASKTWSYTDNPISFSTAMGNVQRLPNGNSLINYGNNTNSNVAFNVVKSTGQQVFKVEFADSLCAYRTYNYFNLPFSLNRPVISCYDNGGQFYLDAGPGHSGYLWSNGATTQAILVSSTGSYFVFVPKGNGGFISSEKFIVSDLSNPCNLSAIPKITDEVFSFSPNPAHASIKIILNDHYPEPMVVEIFTSDGTKVHAEVLKNESSYHVNLKEIKPGFYLIKLGNTIKKLVKI